MEQLITYIKESYNELVYKVTWPSYASLQSSTILVIVASLLLALVIFGMDALSSGALDLVYPAGN